MNNTINNTFIDKLYSLEEYELDDFIMRKSQGRKKEDYKSETDLIMKLIKQGEDMGIPNAEGTTYYYVKTKEDYKLIDAVKNIDEIDLRYYWDTISTLLERFKLKQYIKKRPPLTVIDKKQKSLMEFI